jgi:transposase, IS605 OrfB family, central region
LLYSTLKEKFSLPSKLAQDCYREALTIAKSWLRNKNRGKIPTVKTLRIWLVHGYSYRVRGEHVELIGGLKLKVIGWNRRYDGYPNGDTRLVYGDGKLILHISKRVPKPAKYNPRCVLAVDINEKHIAVGNSVFEYRFETAIEKALRYRHLAERLQKKYSSPGYNAWLRRRGIRERIKYFHRKARSIVEDWAKKTSHKIVVLTKQYLYTVARENLTGLVESLRKLPKDHRVALMILSYRKLEFWIDWQAEKHVVPLITVEPKGTSSICPKCSNKMRENGYRLLRCPACGFEADRDTVAVLNIEKRALLEMGVASDPPDCPADDRCRPESMRGTSEPPKESPRSFRAGRRSGIRQDPTLNQLTYTRKHL